MCVCGVVMDGEWSGSFSLHANASNRIESNRAEFIRLRSSAPHRHHSLIDVLDMLYNSDLIAASFLAGRLSL